MNKLLKLILVGFLYFNCLCFAQENENITIKKEQTKEQITKQVEKQEVVDNVQKIKPKLLIGYYGRPHTKVLGILGQSNIDDLVLKMKKKEAYYNKQLNNQFDIQMVFHIIYGLATSHEGSRGTYMLRLKNSTLMKYINRAKREGFKVIIDLQMGTNTPSEAIQPVLKYLKYDNVFLALDPEFKIPKHKKYPPGKYIGHIFAKDLNDAQELISNYLIENNLPSRDLIVHMFHPRMLRDKDKVKKYDNIELIYNIDGHGHPMSKVKIYNLLYNKEAKNIAKSGFKIFYHADKYIMTPKQIMGLKKTNSVKIWTPPYYINYQ